jgi:hypothetical protein
MEKVSRSAAERTRLIEEYRASSMSASAFAAQAEVPKGTFYNWLSKSQPKAAEMRIARVVREASRTEPPIIGEAAPPIVIECGGARVEVGANFNASTLTAVLDLLQARARERNQ